MKSIYIFGNSHTFYLRHNAEAGEVKLLLNFRFYEKKKKDGAKRFYALNNYGVNKKLLTTEKLVCTRS